METLKDSTIQKTIERFKSETAKNENIAMFKNLNDFCINRGIKTRFYFPCDNIILEGIQNKRTFVLTVIHILEVEK